MDMRGLSLHWPVRTMDALLSLGLIPNRFTQFSQNNLSLANHTAQRVHVFDSDSVRPNIKLIDKIWM
jgi:hypothetical protein